MTNRSLLVVSLYRLVRLVALIASVTFALFLLIKASPIDPINAYLGTAIAHVGPEKKMEIAALWGLDKPIYEQFSYWLYNALSGNLGFSIAYNTSVSHLISDRIWASFALTGLAWLLSGLLGFSLGLIAAANEGNWIDRLIRLYCYILAATPTFWFGMLMLWLFSVQLGWTPICCAGPIGVPTNEVTLIQRLHHLLLPLTVLTLFGIALIALHTRAKLSDVLKADYVTFARAQGAHQSDIVLRHGIRNAALPALTALFASIGEIIGGAILAEQVFSWPGLGRATVEAGIRGDVALLLAIAMLTIVIVSIGNVSADLLYRIVDPRLRGRA